MNEINEVITDLAQGRMVIVVDDDLDREGEADLVVAAELITPEQVAFMCHRGGGILCVPMMGIDLDRLALKPLASDSSDPLGTGWTMSVDLIGTGTGISAEARARTIRALANPTSDAHDFTWPGHIFPLRAHQAGLAARRGHTEASVTLTKLAGLRPTAAICELMLPSGVMASTEDAVVFARAEGLSICTISEIAAFSLVGTTLQ